ncbi:MAG: YndJ family protein [Planctomycetes bacterium]|nr:YndJ family protein [Planctomycetota bacterium]
MSVLWLGAYVHVPLALELMLQNESGRAARYFHHREYTLIPLAISLVVAFATGIGWLALPWLIFTTACAGFGVWRLLSQGLRRPGALADWGLLWFGVSGAWIFASAMRWEVFGFPHIIVLLAGVHQLYAGLVLQVLASRIVAARPGRLPWITAICVSLGNPFVATGILTSHLGMPLWIEFAAVCFYASSVVVLGWMQLFLALWPKSGLPWYSRALLVVSDLSLGTAMTLALIFMWGVRRGYPTLTIPEMIAWHGSLNAFGFGLCALAGWSLAGTRHAKQP